MPDHRYRLFGLNVASEIELPDLHPVSDPAAPDVTIVHARVPPAADGAADSVDITPARALLTIAEAGRYLITGGDRIAVDRAPGVSDRNVRLFLLGSAFGAILHQRGLLPLHANVIDFDGAAIAFMGHSGAGKSTLANWFHDHGRPILSDDVGVVRDDAAGIPMVEPGLPRIRLWADALAASGRRVADYQASFDDMDKYDVPMTTIPAQSPVALAAVYLLRGAAEDRPPGITRLTGVGAIDALVANTYRGGYIPSMGGVARHLRQCVALARQVPIFALDRRWGLAEFPAEAARIEDHIRALPARW